MKSFGIDLVIVYTIFIFLEMSVSKMIKKYINYVGLYGKKYKDSEYTQYFEMKDITNRRAINSVNEICNLDLCYFSDKNENIKTYNEKDISKDKIKLYFENMEAIQIDILNKSYEIIFQNFI